ncbi:DgyrCDS3785 [Dimorphilus gyrociliatus]|uniref:DgyrCDS3785 n=1 Tax=Dimorphilus gyrociliatus TaxID=2664684 RepID=A0A7I8VEQ3_9ANNE|nr:DgyrCDS3785 [Dimorphilus gyrociliatus]
MSLLRVFFWLTYFIIFDSEITTSSTFKAAVYDKPIIPISYDTKNFSQAILNETLKIYKEKADEARKAGVEILVFPENGLLPVAIRTRESVYPFLEDIPSPSFGENACLMPETSNNYIRRTLSCLARDYSMYIVANVGDKKYCTASDDGCPPDGRFQYNTNIAFDPNGVLVARYHKKNLFGERYFNTPKHTDISFFSTPFGVVGNFICFDVVFQEPAIDLIEKHNIDIVAFPTAWMNVLPFYSAVPFHSSWSYVMGVSFLSSNLRFPPMRFSGSGIYAPDGVKVHRNDDTVFDGKLLVSDVKKGRRNIIYHQKIEFNGFVSSEETFQSQVFGDNYTMSLLPQEESSGTVRVCNNGLCCKIDYENRTKTEKDKFALGVFKGMHFKEGTYYLEMCLLLRCADYNDVSSCGQWTEESSTKFDYLNIQANLTSRYAFPVYVSEGISPSSGDWSYDGYSLISNGAQKPLLTAGFYARCFDLDPEI